MYVKVIARKSSDIFSETQCICRMLNVLEVQDGMEWY